MEIGISSASFYPNLNTEDSISFMSNLGFKSGEIFLNSPSEYEEDFIKRILEQKLKYDFKIHSVHCLSSAFEPYLFDDYKRRRDDMLLCFKKICRAAKLLGAKCYTFHGMRWKNINDLNYKFILEIYNQLTYLAMEEGIKLAQENVSWCMSSNLSFLNKIKDNVKYPIHFTLDIKQAYKAHVPPEKYIDVMGSLIANFHVNDRDDNNICLLPGKGEVNFKKISCKLKEIGYNEIGIIEVYSNNYDNYDEIKNSKEFLISQV
ncbi:sugar phosphate isomerase/epimerase [Clostridium sp. P21]|uniref:Sugar phosphate isomerase/epimerase n=1 Tax=Clostridium muellerianum TaxID=2716538 RepID=A0A7Y0EGT8_9CLOT|nr:sugar phosphate isomerase/epimerase [Clostridium muellerianum]NMM63221.1 sugar phosphate isomerase/epimerase [Clostridium muellerianum]